MGAYPFLARRHEPRPPFRRRGFGALEDGANDDGEMRLAIAATVKARTGRFLLGFPNTDRSSAICADRPFWPQEGLHGVADGAFVGGSLGVSA